MNKTADLSDLSDLIPADATVAIGGGWFANHPMAAARQLIRSGRDDLRAIALLGSIDIDLLVGAGVLRHLTFSMVTLEAFGLATNFRREVESGKLAITEISALSLQVALEAGAHSVPFLPLRGPVGSDLVAREPGFYGTASSSFGDDDVPVVRAIRPDVALVHATRCDVLGNAQFEGTFAIDAELARASDRVIVTCEEIVPTAAIAAHSHLTKVPGLLVDAVIEAPYGAHPCSHVPRYAQDAWTILDYQKLALAGGSGFDDFIDLLRNEDEDAYRDRVIGPERAKVLSALTESGVVLGEEAA